MMRTAKKLIVTFGICVILSVAMSACGKKGDLVLPEQQQPKSFSATSTSN
ncbi:LPS translocon maturation chaperone LptM [Kaarinaea lacus]